MYRVPDSTALAVETSAIHDYEERHVYWASLSTQKLQDRRADILAWLVTFTPERFTDTLQGDSPKPVMHRLVELSIINRILSGQGPSLR